jgi:hypothetical protein
MAKRSRLPFSNQKDAPARQEQTKLLGNIEQDLKDAYQMVRSLPSGSLAEESALADVRHLEDRRFSLLSILFGSRLHAYQWGSP